VIFYFDCIHGGEIKSLNAHLQAAEDILKGGFNLKITPHQKTLTPSKKPYPASKKPSHPTF
jgi:hypothetical protein